MNEEELRIKIYERLGLEFASLTSEGGNDWVRAEKEVLDEYKQKEFEKLKDLKQTDYINIEKDSNEFKSIMNTISPSLQNCKSVIAQRKDLDNEDIENLIKDGNKDILIKLTKYQKLEEEQINKILKNSVYLVKKNIIENQTLTHSQIKIIIELMKKNESAYKDLIAKVEHNIY